MRRSDWLLLAGVVGIWLAVLAVGAALLVLVNAVIPT